jgi:plastocyanin
MKRAFAATAVATLLLAACSNTSSSSSGAASPSTSTTSAAITIQLTEFDFLMPDQIPAGVQTLHVENIGGMPHFIEFQQLTGDHTDDDIQALLDDPSSQQPTWLTPAAMPSISLVSPGTSTDITIDLPPGRYAAFCWMPDAQGRPHAMDGMHRVFEVAGAATGSLPQADLTFTWTGSTIDGVPETLSAGAHTIALENTGSKPGQLQFARILEDAPADQVQQDVSAWFKSIYAGPPPAEFLGGLSNMQSDVGVSGTTTLTFADGVYAVGGPGKSLPVLFTVGAGGFPSPSASAEPASCTANGTELTLTASSVAFSTNCLAAPAGEAFTIAFDNQDNGTSHNVAIYPEGDGAKAVFTGDVTTGVSSTTYDVPALDAGTYRFQCDVHPTTMNGTFIVG